MGRLYHYTSQHGCDRITSSGCIKQSQNFERDCVYGDGVYLTTLNPEDFGKADIAKNNYGGAWKKKMDDGRLDCYIEIDIPFSDLKLERCEAKGRDVYLYNGDLVLSKFKWQSGKNSEWTFSEVLGAVALGAAAVGLGALLGKVIYDACKAKNEDPKKNSKVNNP